MSYQYYQQFADDDDVFPVLHEDDNVDHDVEEQEDEEEGCCFSGCKHCLGTDW